MSATAPSAWLIPQKNLLGPPQNAGAWQTGLRPNPMSQAWGGSGGAGGSFLVPQRTPPGPPMASSHPEYFSGINLGKLQAEFPALYDKIARYSSGAGKLGPTYQYLLANLGRAVTADDTFSENDIRNAALAARNPIQAQAYQGRQAGLEAAAINGALDSGDTYRYLALQDAAANQAAEQAASGQVADLTAYNQQARYNALRAALDALNAWAQNRRARRMSDAGASAMVAQMEGQAAAQRAASQWGALSGLLGAASSLAAMKKW